MRAAERAQRVDQVADRPLVHARHAAQLEARALRGASTASAAVSGRIAVPALPRKSVALCARRPAAEAGDDAARAPSRLDARSRARAARRASRGCRRNRAGRAIAVVPSPARPAAARGWRCSSSPAGAPCRRAAQRRQVEEAASCTCGSARLAPTRLSGACAASAAFICQPARASLALRISVFERLGVAGLDHVLHRVERVRGSAASASGSLRGWPSGCRATSPGRWRRCG